LDSFRTVLQTPVEEYWSVTIEMVVNTVYEIGDLSSERNEDVNV